MHEFFVIAGALVVGVVFLDALMTTLTVSAGAGPLSSRVLAVCWRVMLRLHRRDSESSPLTWAGAVLLTMTVFFWVVLLWAGWTLLFAGSQAVVDAKTQEPAGVADVIYFTGFTVFTLGVGDFVADAPGWRVVTAVASFSGLFLITLAITYLISVVSAVVQRRVLAIQVHSLGRSTTDIVRRGWDGTQFSDMFQQQLVSLLPSVVVSSEQHLAYPVLHYFHSRTASLAAPRAIVHLDESLTLLTNGVPEDHRPDASAVEPLRYALNRYLAAATGTTWSPEASTPPPPPLGALREAGIPQVDEASYLGGVEADHARRATLHRLVASDGWSWPRP